MIRRAQNTDVEDIYALIREGVHNGKVLKRSLKELKTIIPNFFVYEENNIIVGCCSLEIYSKKLAEIRSLIVTCNYRNRGIGSALIERCLSEAKRKGIYQVLSVTDKHCFFKRFGFGTVINAKQAMFLNLNLKKITSS